MRHRPAVQRPTSDPLIHVDGSRFLGRVGCRVGQLISGPMCCMMCERPWVLLTVGACCWLPLLLPLSVGAHDLRAGRSSCVRRVRTGLRLEINRYRASSCETYDVLLRELAVENFRPFEATSVRLPDSGLVLVAGAINAGKSALLSALDLVAGIGLDTTAWRRAGSSEHARVSATFDLSAEYYSCRFSVSDRAAAQRGAGSHGSARCRHPLPVGRVQRASAARRAE